MKIYGLEKFSMVDFPGHLCCTLFTGGCNFRCPYCQNGDLVNLTNLRLIEEQEIFEFLNKRKGAIDAVCVSGGEPTLYPDLPQFIAKIKALGFLVKLDTNGTNPQMLKSLIDKNLIDYVAMDIKSDDLGYLSNFACSNADLLTVKESVNILKQNKVPYEFRTTLIKQLHNEQTVNAIATWLSGATNLYLQAFVDHPSNLTQGLTRVDQQEAQIFAEILRKTIKNVELRGY